jgi:hypothetical protein
MRTPAKTASFILRDCDPALWRRFKAKAKREGHTLRGLFLVWIRAYLASEK